MEQAPTLDRKAIAQEVAAALKDKLSQHQVTAIHTQLTTWPKVASGNVNVASFIFYQQWQVNINGGKTFNGKSGGLAGPGGGVAFGDLYADSLDNVYRNTQTFMFTSVGGVYITVQFFDQNHTCIGTFQAGGIGTVAGIGGGTGSWG
jgi:hypothetical protein